MMRPSLAAAPFVLGLAAFTQPGSFPAPIEPAGEGKLQCHSPDHARKTCQSLAAYRPAANGGFDNLAGVALPTAPVTVMEIVSPVTVRDGKVCGYMRQADIDKARFTINGVEADAATTSNYRKRVTAMYQSMFGHELCSAYVADGGELVTQPTIDGVPEPSVSHRVIWVSPDDGWKVG